MSCQTVKSPATGVVPQFESVIPNERSEEESFATGKQDPSSLRSVGMTNSGYKFKLRHYPFDFSLYSGRAKTINSSPVW